MISYSHWGMFDAERPVVININMPITINGRADKEDIGRTAYQATMKAARQLAAAR